MSMTTQSRRSAWTIPAIVMIAGLAIFGCSDHRISYDEFLKMQQPQPNPAALDVSKPADPAVVDRQLGPNRLGPGDIVAVTVTPGNPENIVPPVQTRVTTAGLIEVPLAGTVQVEGMTLEEAEAAVRAAYVPKLYPKAVVLVTIAQAQTTNVMVIGAVAEPGLVPLRRTERNLLYAVVGAGGVAETASGKVTLRRLREPEATTVDIRDTAQLAAALNLAPLQNGDIVEVQAAKTNTLWTGGLVNVAGPQLFAGGDPPTILQAIAASGGLRTDLFPKEGTLIRRQDGKDIHVRLDLTSIATGKAPNITLAPGDILWVPHTTLTRIHDFINQNMSFRTGASATYSATGSKRYGDDAGSETAYIR